MRTDYFDDLLPDSVTHVTQQKKDCVTPTPDNVTSENSDLAEASRVSRMSRTETGNTRNFKAYKYRLKEWPASEMILIAPGTSLEEAQEGLRARFGDRLIDVKRYTHGKPPADDGATGKGE